MPDIIDKLRRCTQVAPVIEAIAEIERLREDNGAGYDGAWATKEP